MQEAQPTWQISVLVRDEKKAAQVQETLPNVEIVLGSLDDSDIIKGAASKADIVIRKDTQFALEHLRGNNV